MDTLFSTRWEIWACGGPCQTVRLFKVRAARADRKDSGAGGLPAEYYDVREMYFAMCIMPAKRIDWRRLT